MALYLAAMEGHVSVVELLLQQHANICTYDKVYKVARQTVFLKCLLCTYCIYLEMYGVLGVLFFNIIFFYNSLVPAKHSF